MRATRLALLALVACAVALAGCDKARSAKGGPAVATDCTGCHGGRDNATGAPPNDTAGNTANTARGVGAHTVHVNAGLDCENCHVKPSRLRDPGHISGTAEIVFGPAAKRPGGALPLPVYDRASGTCSNVYCHGAKLPVADRGAATAPVWTASPLPGAPCASCHGQANNAGAPPAPHQTGLTPDKCTTCHPDTVNGNGDLIPEVQGGRHLNGAVDIAALACTSCHGDLSGARLADAGTPAAFAPPLDTASSSTGAKVGAHLRHVSSVTTLASRYTQPFPCTECHVVPQTSGPHGPASVVQFGTAVTPAKNISTTGGLSPVYAAAGGTCASTYCHGGSLNAGGTAAGHTPAWNTSSADGCGTCHFQGSTVASAAAHPQLDAVINGQPITANTQCYKCHAGTVNTSGGIIIGLGNHVNGTVEFTSPHDAGWIASSVHGAAAKRDLALCQGCHGANFGTVVSSPGGNAKSCNTCHANPAVFITPYAGGLHPAWQTECTFCHGTPGRSDVAFQDTAGTPPVNAGRINPPEATQATEQSPTDNAVGAHMRHTSDSTITGNRYANPVKCQQCHGANVLTDAAHQGVGHVDSLIVIGWQLAATGTVPTINPPLTLPASTIPAARNKTGALRGTPVSCANYCHGATISGGLVKTVTWNAAGSVTGCDSCHGFPPTYTAPTWHTAGANKGVCSDCHYAGLPDATVDKALHLNGVPNLVAGLACNACHGGVANAAPPGAASANVVDTDPRVGAHQAHVTGTSLRATPIACPECHGTLPTTPGHADGVVTLSWSTLASAQGSPLVPTAGTKQPGLTATCTNYCHGGKWTPATPVTNLDYKGLVTSPAWTQVGTGQAACGTCHKIAPGNSTHAGANAAVGPTNCQTCHVGYDCTSDLPGSCQVNKLTHLNGQLDANLTCTSCHGTAGRTMVSGTFGPYQANANNVVAMPPRDTANGATGLQVGAHASHAVPSVPAQQIFRPVLCAECHGVAVNGYTASHKNGTTELTFASSASANLGNVAAAIVRGAGTTPDTCATYCHGASLTPAQRGSVTQWQWSTSSPQATCGSCHAQPPGDPVHTSVAAGSPTTACNGCHGTVVNTSGGIIFNGTGSSATTLHMNGSRQNTATCFSCHGSSATGSIAPPAATSGSSAVTNPKVGAHQKHLTGTTLRSAAVACTVCHALPGSTAHATGAVDFSWSGLAIAGTGYTLNPAAGPLAAGWEATPTCTNYCHGGKWAAIPTSRGNQYQPNWTLGTSQAACNSCHLAPPGTSDHASVTSSTNCGDCHAAYSCFGNSLATCQVNKGIHLNGSVEATGGTCVGCHAQAITTGSVPRRAIVPEFGYAWSHKRSASPARTVTANDCAVCHMEGVAATGAIDTTYHRNGLVNLRDPDLGTQIKQVTWGGANAGGYTSTGVDATFATFGRNLSSNVLEQTVQAIMINQCLKCHDADGAASALAQVPTGSPAKPFGTTITGAEYTGSGITALGTPGGVVDVNASFAVTNASYHPIRGKQNNSYVTATRMNAPWTGITKTAGNTTSWGYLISCWDCHAPTGATGLQTLTVTAHGGTTTLRRNVYLNSAADNLCRVCHIARIGNGDNHGTGSAFATGGGGGMGSSRIDVTCFNCHGSKNGTAATGTANRPPRPYVAQDAHGFDGFSPAMGADLYWPTGSASNTYKPYAFMRNVGPTGSWNNNLNWRPAAAPGITTGGATCGGNLTSAACNENMQTYTPGGNF